MSIEVTVRDTETGESDTATIENDVIVITGWHLPRRQHAGLPGQGHAGLHDQRAQVMTCTHTLWDLGGAHCTRPDVHATGHVYTSSTGSDVSDRHDATSGGEH